MKKLLLAALAAVTIGVTAEAQQVQQGDIAPNFTLTDINGTSHNLYNYLDSGYMVIVDVSAAWCGPCWTVHSSHVFNTLTTQYGVNGTISPKKIKVIYIEGETTNTTAQLHGPANMSGTYATITQGDWVTGTLYPIIDDASENGHYMFGGFPSFTIITRDRIVQETIGGYTNAMLQTPFWTAYLNNGPQTGPSATVDAKILNKDQAGPFFCTATPKIRFQNYSQTQSITNATLKVLVGSTAVSTQTWTGNLAPYAFADVTMPGFMQAGPYKFEVTVTGDTEPANNSMVATMQILTPATAVTAPNTENLDNNAFPASYIIQNDDLFAHSSNVSSGGNPVSIVGVAGTTTQVGAIFYPNVNNGVTGEIMLGNYNTSTASAPSFQFDFAHASDAASGAGGADKLEIFESKDCGVTWQSVFSQQGTTLSTVSTFATSAFIPTAASDWKHKGSNPLSKNTNLFLKLKATSSGGQNSYGWFDNMQVATTLAVGDVVSETSINLYPNPTRDEANLEFSVVKPANVTVQVVDIMGRVVTNVANENMTVGSHKLTISTSNLPSGVYNVKIQTEAGSRTERLTVVK